MEKNYFTVDRVAELLHIHPKTVQRYIREGRLHAVKIGKSWRISGHDLSLFVEGRPQTDGFQTEESERVRGRITLSSVIDVDVATTAEAVRIVSTLSAAMNNKPPGFGSSTMHTQYIEAEHRVRINLWGNLPFLSAMLDFLSALTGEEESVDEEESDHE